MKALLLTALLLAALLFTGCSREEHSTEDVSAGVKQSMQDKFNTDANFSKYDMTVTKVVVVRSDRNRYEGVATVRVNNANHDVSVQVTADDKGVIWTTEPGTFAFLAHEQQKSWRP